MEPLSLNYGQEHFRRLDLWNNDELETLGLRLVSEMQEADVTLLAIGNIFRERAGQQRMFTQEAPGYDDRQGEVEQALRREATE